MALRCTASASKRPEEVRKPQQGLAARFKLCGRKPLRGLPPSPRWTWRCALREANVRKGLGGHTRSSGTYLGPSGCANAPRNFVLRAFSQYREAESPRCGERAAARKRRGRASGTQVRAEHSKEGAAGNFFVRPPTRHAPYRIPAVGGVATALPLPASYAQELRALNG